MTISILFLLKIEAMNRIKKVLETKGIKQVWLAEKLGKSFNMVNSYVQNRTQPSLEVLFKVAEILEVDVKDLIDSKGNGVKRDSRWPLKNNYKDSLK